MLKGENGFSGASDLSMDATNPRILYAAFWDHQRTPWYVRSGGPGSGIWKSLDGGDTWTRLTQGLPSLLGKIGVAVSPANPDRVFAIAEAEKGGLFRSDDAGKTWRRLTRGLPGRPEVATGVGDDCAVVRPTGARHDLIFTTDAVIEGVHFRPDSILTAGCHDLLRNFLAPTGSAVA